MFHKNCRLQRDLNSERRSRRRARWLLDHHGPTDYLIFSAWNEAKQLVESHCLKRDKNSQNMGSGFGSVGRAVASNSRSLRFESRHWQQFILNIYCQLYWKDENKEKEAANGPCFKNSQNMFACLSCFQLRLDFLEIVDRRLAVLCKRLNKFQLFKSHYCLYCSFSRSISRPYWSNRNLCIQKYWKTFNIR